MISGSVLMIDPSDRGGIAAATGAVAAALLAAGARPEVLASRARTEAGTGYPVFRWLPAPEWGRPERPGAVFYARRLSEWTVSALAVEAVSRLRAPAIADFQAPLNRRFDARLIRRLRRRLPIAWTVHDPLPLGGSDRDRERFAGIYAAADLVVVHSDIAAERIRRLAGVDPVVLELPPPELGAKIEPSEARRRLGLPPEGRLLGALGFIRAYKGYDLLAEVWERLGPEAPRLLVMGELVDPAGKDSLARLEATGRAELRIGYASDADLGLAFNACDAVLLPHVEASPSGLLATARALSIPVIASDAPELAAAVSSSDAGSVVRRDVERWADAVRGPLPDPAPPPTAPDLASRRLEAYERARSGWEGRGAASTWVGRPGPGRGARRLRLVVYTDATSFAGAEVGLATLLAGLPDEYDVAVLGVSREVVERLAATRDRASAVVVPPVASKWDLGAIIAHYRAISRLGPDIFHANLRIPWSCQYGIAAAQLLPGVKTVAVEQLPVPPSSELQRRLKWISSLRLDAHVAVGERVACEIEAEVGLPAGLVRSIPNTVADCELEPVPRPVRGPIVGTLARLVPEKGTAELIRALSELPEVTALLVGDGPDRDSLERLGASLGVAERLIVTGWVDNPRDWLGAMDVFVLPSRREGLPHALLEAMLASVPVVSTDVGSIGEAIVDGETGLLVPTGDPARLAAAVARLLGDRELARQLARRGRDTVLNRFRPESMIVAYEALYGELCS